jgi:hypothetical protein
MSSIPLSMWRYNVLPFLDRAQLTALGYTLDACRIIGIPPRSLDPALFTARLHQTYEFRTNSYMRLRTEGGPAEWWTFLVRILDTEKHVVVTLHLGLLCGFECTMSVRTNTFLNPDQTEPEVPLAPGIMRFVDSATIRVMHGPGEVVERSVTYYNAELGTGKQEEYRPLEVLGQHAALRKVDMIV